MKIKINPGLEHVTDRSDLLRDFVIFVCKDLRCMPCDIDIVNGREGSGLKTTAQYDPNNHHVMVNAKNRHFGDVLRSIAHELVHHKQNVNGELSGPVQDVGGDIEDEANARAGALLKSFAYQEGPERIYESPKHRALFESESEQLEKGLSNLNKRAPFTSQEARDLLRKAREADSLTGKAKKFADETVNQARDLGLTVTAKGKAALDYIKRKGYKLRKAGAPQERFRDGKISRDQAKKILSQHPLDQWTETVFTPVPFRGTPTRSTSSTLRPGPSSATRPLSRQSSSAGCCCRPSGWHRA